MKLLIYEDLSCLAENAATTLPTLALGWSFESNCFQDEGTFIEKESDSKEVSVGLDVSEPPKQEERNITKKRQESIFIILYKWE